MRELCGFDRITYFYYLLSYHQNSVEGIYYVRKVIMIALPTLKECPLEKIGNSSMFDKGNASVEKDYQDARAQKMDVLHDLLDLFQLFGNEVGTSLVLATYTIPEETYWEQHIDETDEDEEGIARELEDYEDGDPDRDGDQETMSPGDHKDYQCFADTSSLLNV